MTRLVCEPGTDPGEATARLLRSVDTPAVAVLGPGDRLTSDAVSILGSALRDAEVAYADEDQIDIEGRSFAPCLKPDWSPELLLSTPYLGRPLVMRRDVVEAAGGIRPLADGGWEHDLMLRVTERAPRVTHVPEVLCHRHRAPESGGAPIDSASAMAVEAALRRRNESATVEQGPVAGAFRVRRRLARTPSVSAIVPFRDGARYLRTCVDSVSATADGVSLELVLVDNGSTEPETVTLVERFAARADVTVIRDPRPFNWAALNNAAVRSAAGEILLFLNNDIEAIKPGWLATLAAQALRPDVAAAGARLLYPDRRVQHVGVVIGLGGAAGHVLAGLPGEEAGYLGMAVLTRDCSAVTGACMAVRRSVFDEVGGFDEELGLDTNDIDFCLRARQLGYRVVLDPLAELVHHESPSRGTSGSVPNIVRFVDRWEHLIVQGDPFLNRNLTRIDSSCALRGPDEEGWWRQWRSILTSS